MKSEYEFLSSGMLRRVVLYLLTDFSKVLTAAIIRAMSYCNGELVFSLKHGLNY
jgi:hypothetical protein